MAVRKVQINVASQSPEADIDVEDLAMVLKPVERDGRRAWLAGFEFVLQSR